MKYIVFDNQYPVIFSKNMTHAAFRYSDRTSSNWVHMRPTSAGFCNVFAQDIEGMLRATCYGESITLNLKSNPEEDSQLITEMLRR